MGPKSKEYLQAFDSPSRVWVHCQGWAGEGVQQRARPQQALRPGGASRAHGGGGGHQCLSGPGMGILKRCSYATPHSPPLS
jgi:hypothetical protein